MFKRLPMYQRIGAAAYKANLNNTIEMSRFLDNPEKKFLSIHIAGTNGKGSTAHLAASVLQDAGYKTGLYTSPHYLDFRERVKINGGMIPQNFVVEFIRSYKEPLEKIDLSFFEMTVGLAFSFFADEKVDIAVIETGMGGRLDSTNIITPEVSVITNIGNDHKQYLGNTISRIAREKAGIIKPNVPVIIGETQPETKPVFEEFAYSNNAAITFADKIYQVEKINIENKSEHLRRFRKKGKHFFDCPFKSGGIYQNKNLATAFATIETLINAGFDISNQNIQNGFYKVIENTGLKGRWQVIGENPLIVCDSGHNPEGIIEVLDNIRATPHRQLHFVFGMVNDKQPETILSLLPDNAAYYFCKADIPRGMSANELAISASKNGLSGIDFPSVKTAFEAAADAAHPNDMILVGGSTFIVAEMLQLYCRH
jgi:dihydrofolate synthase / folylpolyglutamate synthase